MAKILVADDDRLTLELIERALARKGHEVEVFADGAEACEAIAEGDHDLVVSDLRMPGRDGMDVLRAAKARRASTPVFLLSGAWQTEERDEALRAGAYVALQKPIDLRYLYKLIESVTVKEHPQEKHDRPASDEPPQVPPAPAPAPAAAAEAVPLAAPLVLVLEPDRAMRKLIEYCLKRQGFRVTATGDDKEALELAALEPPDAVLAGGAEDDVRGLALVEGLRRDLACGRTYVVFVYPEGAVADAVHALDAGADVALERPCEPDVLFAHVKAGVRRALKAHGGGGNGHGSGHRWLARSTN
jgi:DNA-binding response OmpR family regulator